MNSIWVERLWGFVFGVISSIVAEILIFFFFTGKNINRIQKYIIRTVSIRRLKNLNLDPVLDSDDPHAFIRNEWAFALRDLGSKNPDETKKALQSLFHMADILQSDEREVAHEALRLRYATNNLRDADADYLKTMNKLLV